jgi:hypothetical protein
MNKTHSAWRLSVLLSVFVLAAGCSTGPAVIDTSSEAKATFDGLYPVKNAKADEAWARADFDLSRYTKIMAVRANVQYRIVTNGGQSNAGSSRTGQYFIDAAARTRFEALASQVFLDELGKSEHYTLVDEPGPDVLLVSGSLLDIASFVPQTQTGMNSGVAIRKIGEATLVLELRDSQSGTALARSVDRRAAEHFGGKMQPSTTVSNRQEVTRLLKFWAERLREGLDGFSMQSAK